MYESTFYIILDGRVKVTKVMGAAHDEVRTLKTLETGDFFGEMALLQNSPRAATVTTTAPTEVLEIRKEYFNELLRSSASLARAMVQEVVRRLRQNDAMAIEDLRVKAGELAGAYQQLAEQEYARSGFLTTIAHEMHAPLTAAQGFVQMVNTSQASGSSMPPELQSQAIQTASASLQQIIALVNDLLLVQEMDLVLPPFTPTNLAEVLRQVGEACRGRLVENRLNLFLNLPTTPLYVSGDSNSLQRALQAILDNSIKYSHDGGQIDVSLTRRENQAMIEFRDYGIGIATDKLPYVFDRFFHSDQTHERPYGGIGLGLSLARQVIEQHSGKIEIAGQENEGTTVTITLQTTPPPA
jgi:signal transduction histidine kinase